MTVRPGFLLAAEGPLQAQLSTGVAAWECVRLSGYQFLPVDPRVAWAGAKLAIHGAEIDWEAQLGRGDGWKKAEIVGRGEDGAGSYGEFARERIWCLRPAMLPPTLEEEVHVGVARHVQKIDSLETRNIPVNSADHLHDEAQAWNQLLSGKASLTIPPRTLRRVIVDLDNYYCAYPQLITSDGEGSTIRIHWAESLLENKAKQKANPPFQPKGNRDQIEGKLFNGVGDTFETHGGSERHFQTLWWEGGRYVEFVIATTEQAMVIDKFWLLETHYPYHLENRFEASDARLAEVIPLALRTLQMCSHETYMDCPYYEQLMYVGDTRLEVLTTYAICRDDRLPRKALTTFDFSRRPDGLTQARYPSQVMQIIPPFSLWWVAMVCDNAMWRDDREFVLAHMPGARGVLDAFLQRVNADGLLEPYPGWNFADWVPQWSRGVPPTDKTGISALFNFQLVWILRQMAEVETSLGEPELAARDRRNADRIAGAASAVFWDERRGLFADDLAREHFSEHAQCLALLSDSVSDARRQRVRDGLLTDPKLSRTTIYFDHYLFETFRVLKLPDRLIERMGLWFDLKRNGLRTTVEMPEPCRSDCHAWGRIRSSTTTRRSLGFARRRPDFERCAFEPQLGSLSFARDNGASEGSDPGGSVIARRSSQR